MIRRAGALAIAAGALATAPAAAETIFGGSLNVRAGYGSNPYLTAQSNGGAGLVGATLNAAVTQRGALSSTTLSGTADVEQSTGKYGRNENYIASLRHVATLSERITANAGASIQSTFNPGQLSGSGISYNPFIGAGSLVDASNPTNAGQIVGFDTNNLDVLTIGQRTRVYAGDAGVQWQATGRDNFRVSGNASHVDYKSFAGDYDSYGGTFGYLRTLSARTKVGVNLSANAVNSDFYPNSSSYSANGTLVQQLNSIWLLNLNVGGIFPRGGYGTNKGVSLGFSGSLCGEYPRYSLCLSASRQATPSGVGGLRTTLQADARLSYKLDERSSVTGSLTYSRAGSGDGLAVPHSTYYLAAGSYSRSLTQRISIGGSARYQRREYGGPLGNASGYAVTVDVTTRFGRVAS